MTVEYAKKIANEIYDKMSDAIVGLEGSEWWESNKATAKIAVEYAFEGEAKKMILAEIDNI